MLNRYTNSISLRNGVQMPQIGLGVYKMTNPEQTVEAITHAIRTGYRAIDTAALYGNEKETGEAVRASGVPREALFITSKVWNRDQGYDQTLRAFEHSLERLGFDYLDLYLTHWPVPELYTETYRAIERLYDEKLLRATGVSNHHEHHLEALLHSAHTPPMVNQIELHPRLTQEQLRAFCQQQGIAVTAWSPLARGGVLSAPEIVQIAEKYDKTPAQVILRWHLQNGVIAIPKSVTPARIEENIAVADFRLTDEEISQIDAMNRNERTGQNPDSFHFDF